MPLPFQSRHHGVVAFGFFNIEIDMLLLEELFFFAEPFCLAVGDLLAAPGAAGGEEQRPVEVTFPGWRIDEPAAAGNVNLAISRQDLSGFIGATYQRFPFPERPEGFKQKPSVEGNRPWAEETIGRFGHAERIVLRRDEADHALWVSVYAFDEAAFGELVAYVDRGGYPRWQGEVRPRYVSTLMERLRAVRGRE